MDKNKVIMPENYSISYSEGAHDLWSVGAHNNIPKGRSSTQYYQKGDMTLYRVRAALQRALFEVEGQISLMPESP